MAAAADYGAAQSFQQALPTIAGLYEAGGRLQAGAQAHAASLAAQGAQANAHLSLQHNQFVAAQDHATQRDLFESTHAIEMANQRAQLTDWLNSRALSEHEQRRYDAMNNAVAEVYRNDDLSQEEKLNLAMKLKTGIDVYEDRQRKAAAKLKNEQDQHLLDLHAKTTRLQDQDNQIQGQSAQQRTSPIQLSDGRVVDATYEGNGKWHYHEKQPAKASEKPVTRFGDESGTFSYKNALPEAKAEAEAAFPVDKQPGPDGKGTVDANAKERAKYMQQVLDRMRGEHARTHGPDVGGGEFKEQPPDQQPFKSPEEASDLQKAQLSTWKQQTEAVQKLPIPEPAKKDYSAATSMLQALLQDYGTVADPRQMDDVDKVLWQWAVGKKAEIEKMQFQGPQPPRLSRFGGDLRNLVRPRG